MYKTFLQITIKNMTVYSPVLLMAEKNIGIKIMMKLKNLVMNGLIYV